MNLAETLRGLLRRWYIVIPGLILAVAVAIGAWFIIKPGYERTATQLLLPGAESMPENANPFLFLGGLSNAADVLVRAVGAENVLSEVAAEYPEAEVEVTRDGSTPGPVILVTVTGSSDEEAGAVLAMMIDRTATLLEGIQRGESIAPVNRITVVPVTVDDVSTLQQRERIIVSVGSGVGLAVLVILGASLFDGLRLDKRRRGRGAVSDADGDPEGRVQSGREAAATVPPDADMDASDPQGGIDSLFDLDGDESIHTDQLKTSSERGKR